MSILAEVRAVFDASSALKAKDDIDKLKGVAPGAADAMGLLEKATAALANPLIAAGAAITTAMTAMVAMGFKAIEAADNLRDLATGTGKTIAELQTMASVAEKSGGTLEGVGTGLDYISRMLAKGGDETMKYTKALDYFGISQTDANGKLKDAAVIAQEVAEAYSKTTNSSSAQAAAADALGRNYKQLVPTYLELNTAQDEMNYLYSVGAVVTKEQADASDTYNDTIHDLGSILKGVGNFVAVTMLPLLQAFASQLKESATNGGILQGVMNVLKGIFEGLVFAGKSVMAVFIGIDTVFQAAGKTLGAFAAIAASVLSGDFAGAKTIWKELGKDVDDLAQRAGKRIDDMFAGIKVGAATADAEVKKLDRGNYRNTNERKVTVKVEGLSDLEKADNALIDLIDQMTKQNKLIETQSKLQEVLAQLEGSKYTAGSQALKDQVVALAKVNDQLTQERKLTQDLNDLKKAGRDQVQSIDDELNKRNMSADAYRRMTAAREVDARVAEKVAKLNSNVEGYEQRKQALIDEGIAQKGRLTEANDRLKESEGSWTDGANQALIEYQDKVSNVAKMTKDAMSNAFQGAEDALVKFVMTGKLDFASLAQSIIADLARMAIRAVITKSIMAFFGSWGNGGTTTDSGGMSTSAFASGDVVTSATTFPMANGGQGVMGEAGPEAVMPLTRMPNGRLGVQAETGDGGGGGSFNVGGIFVTVQGGNGTGSNSQDDQKKQADAIGGVIEQRLKALINSEYRNQHRPGNPGNPTRVTRVF